MPGGEMGRCGFWTARDWENVVIWDEAEWWDRGRVRVGGRGRTGEGTSGEHQGRAFRGYHPGAEVRPGGRRGAISPVQRVALLNPQNYTL